MIAPSQLRYFLEVARSGSIRAAADRLHIAPSAVSRQVLQLERNLGAPLLERRARGVVLTEAGKVYVRYALDVMHRQQRMQSELELLHGLQRGHISVATVEGVIADLLGAAVAHFRKQFPGLTFYVTMLGTDEVARSVREGQADMGLAFYAEPHENLHFAMRSSDPVCAVMAPDHPFAQRRSIGLMEIMDEPLAIPFSTFGIRHMIDAECRNLGRQVVSVLETNSIEAMRDFARNGAGITLLTRLSVWRDIRAAALVAVPMADASFRKASIDLIVMAERALPLAAGRFVEFLQGEMARLTLQRTAQG